MLTRLAGWQYRNIWVGPLPEHMRRRVVGLGASRRVGIIRLTRRSGLHIRLFGWQVSK